MGEEEDDVVVLELDMGARLIVVVEGAVKETMVTEMAIGDWVDAVEGVEGAGLF